MGKTAKVTSKKTKVRKRSFSSSTRRPELSSTKNSPVDQVLNLQRTMGNKTVQNLFKSGAIQPKLKIGEPGDKYELEADRMAEQVMRMPDSVCPGCLEKKNEESVQPKVKGSNTTEMFNGIETGIGSLRGGGQPLPESSRNYFGPRFGYDFSGVRVHTGSEANEAAKSIDARAFTLGKEIVLGTNDYSPETAEGKKLLAHELTHIIQQNQHNTGIQRASLTEEEKRGNLKSEKYAPNQRLQNAFDNDPLLRFGEQGEAVKLIQEGLVEDGFPMPESTKPTGEMDGIFGQETLRTVKQIQTKYGLLVDGIVGRETMGKLDELAQVYSPILPSLPSQGGTEPSYVPPIPSFGKGSLPGKFPGMEPYFPPSPPKAKAAPPKENCLKGESYLNSSPRGPSPQIAGRMYFCLDSRELGEEEKNLINAQKDGWIRALDQMVVEIGFVGYADTRGNEAYNYDLALDRARNVKEYIFQEYKHENLKLFNVFSWGESFSDPAFHEACRRVNIVTVNYILPRKRVPVNSAVERCKNVLNTHYFPEEQKKRLMCTLDKVLEVGSSDDYFNKNNRMYAWFPGGAPNELFPVFFNHLRKELSDPEFAHPDPNRVPDHVVKSNLERLDTDILEGIQFLEGKATSSGGGEDLTTQQLRERVHLLQGSQSSIYWCYGKGQ